jgi:hypothetical protein
MFIYIPDQETTTPPSGSTNWGDIGGDVEDQADLIDLINSTVGGLTESDVLMLLPNINTQISQAIAQQASPDLTALTELVNQKIDQNDLQMLLPDVNTQIKQAIAALPIATSTIDLTDIWTYGGNY